MIVSAQTPGISGVSIRPSSCAGGVYTIFKYATPDFRTGTPGLLEWFVPGDVPEREEIIAWLQKELVGFTQEPANTSEPDYPFPGQKVGISISFFSGIEPYLEREYVEKLARIMKERLALHLKGRVIKKFFDEDDQPDPEGGREDDILGPEGLAPV